MLHLSTERFIEIYCKLNLRRKTMRRFSIICMVTLAILCCANAQEVDEMSLGVDYEMASNEQELSEGKINQDDSGRLLSNLLARMNDEPDADEAEDVLGEKMDDQEDVLGEKMDDEGSDKEVAETEWQNRYDQPLHAFCSYGYGIKGFRSSYSSRHRDRQFQFTCGRVVPPHTSRIRCKLSGYINYWDLPASYMCPADQYMAGVVSYHNNFREDRRMKIKCCRAPGFTTKKCAMTRVYINNFRQYINFRLRGNRFMVGLTSYHDNGKEDRRYKIIACTN